MKRRISETMRGVLIRGLQLLGGGALFGVAVFASAGTRLWWQAWVFLGIYFGSIAFVGIFVARDAPELIAERGRVGHAAKWDTAVTATITVLTLCALAVAGLDVRYSWSSVPFGLSVAGFILYIAGEALAIWAMSANRFFSRVVRIQDDRGHEVCSSGPYAYVRHPGYSGMIMYSLAMPLGLGSWYAFGPALLVVFGFVVRTAGEDRYLRNGLEGYREYASHVRYRLVPGVW
ncbi:MAG: isoprenylcysteine carboxylmethyltransferase family protein [Coriobacteriia bacterium]|jgi:protein-S-isoprenylcysteine O-methyltransferase Ste14|nr:isoprenylcysteine carboxylmethyltransferase family protein [Coriobacteriia bacterium]